MNHPTEPAAPHQTPGALDRLISEAFGATRVLPPHDRCVELRSQLRAAIEALHLDAREARTGTVEYSRDWWRLTNAITDADHALAEDLGSGLLSAALHVAELARRAQALRGAMEGLR
ncbi:DUF6415 family natural product biosynthesis protein [Streptomyces sp. NPDC001634]|uniref:DUF6415 family natural product biosynthesis protein n=1 Tax=Streptomyces sp. NPDC001634 TaxID=3154390 RepID=UPI00332DDA73